MSTINFNILEDIIQYICIFFGFLLPLVYLVNIIITLKILKIGKESISGQIKFFLIANLILSSAYIIFAISLNFGNITNNQKIINISRLFTFLINNIPSCILFVQINFSTKVLLLRDK